jgi:multidrug efflux pump subunit AcrA (membrane-fusion protein)
MKDYLKRRWAVVAAVAIIGLGLFIKQSFADMKKPPKEDPPKSTIVPVQISTIENVSQTATVNFSGRLMSQRKIDVFSEVNGQLVSGTKAFKDGTAFKKGEVLLKLNDSDTRYNIVVYYPILKSITRMDLTNGKAIWLNLMLRRAWPICQL